MNNKVKLLGSLVIIAIGIWLLLPPMPIIKPLDQLPINVVWWPNLLMIIKGMLPIILLIFGGLLFWIEFDEYTSRNISGDLDKGKNGLEDIDEEEMPAFEDVEYKDLECPECGEEFKTDIGLKVHRKVNHPEEYKENPDHEGEK